MLRIGHVKRVVVNEKEEMRLVPWISRTKGQIGEAARDGTLLADSCPPVTHRQSLILLRENHQSPMLL